MLTTCKLALALLMMVVSTVCFLVKGCWFLFSHNVLKRKSMTLSLVHEFSTFCF